MLFDIRKNKNLMLQFLLKNNNWIKTEFLILPQVYVRQQKRFSEGFHKSIVVYISYKEIFHNTEFSENSEEIFINELKEFDFRDLLLILAKLNYLLSGKYNTVNPDELSYINELFTGIPKQRFINLWYLEKRKLFFRQQLLFLIKTNLIKNNFKKGKKLVKQDLNKFGRVIFRVTDLINSEEMKDINSKRADLIRNLYINSSQSYKYLLPRYWTIYFECRREAEKKFPKEIFPILKTFNKITGIDLKFFFFLTLGLYSNYLVHKKEIVKNPEKFLIGSNYFRRLKLKYRKKAKKIFSLLSSTKNILKKEFEIIDSKLGNYYYNFQPLWRNPLYKYNSKTYFLLDPHFFQEKTTFGIYDEINTYLIKKIKKTSGKRRNKYIQQRNLLNSFTGRCLEIYVHKLLRRIYPKRDLLEDRLISGIEGDISENVDFIIKYEDSVVLLEVTISGINHNTLIKADLDEIDREIKGIFFGRNIKKIWKSKGKIYQFESTISDLKKGIYSKFGITSQNIKEIYPVLLVDKGLPDLPFMLDRYLKWIKERDLLKGVLKNIMFINTEDLEIIETLIKDGIPFPEIIRGYNNSNYRGLPFKNYIIFELKRNVTDNKFLISQLSKMIEKMYLYFKK